jgi:4-amino-4-deoxy-L-arabinose transferase-like glycosyltransferase
VTAAGGHARWLILLTVLAVVAVWIGWVGYLASDDDLYYLAALRWVRHPPFEGDNHWATRFPVVISFAALIAALGKGFAAFHAMSLGWFAALITITGLFTRSMAGARAGWIAAILVATMPTLVTFSSLVNCDMPEAVLLIGGIWLIGTANKAPRPLLQGLISGLCFGLAVLCRETALLPLVGLVPLFLIGKPVRRDVLLACGAGFAVILLGEMAFQFAMTGDPMRRYAIAAHHDSHIDRAANLEGNFLVHPLIDPLLVLLINDDFALLFWFGIAAVVLGAWRHLPAPARPRMTILVLMAVADFLLVGGLTHMMVLNPRYFALAALTIAMIVAIWLANMRPRACGLILAILVGANMLAMSLANDHPRWASSALLMAAKSHPDVVILTDADTSARADLPREFAGLHNIAVGDPKPGSLYLRADDRPLGGATPVALYPSPPTVLGRVIQRIGLGGVLPARVAKRLLAPNPTATLWQVNPGRSHP